MMNGSISAVTSRDRKGAFPGLLREEHAMWLRGVCIAFVLLMRVVMGDETRPIALHPENPHYLLFHDKPTILITSGEHYGAVLNLDFDYAKYLDTLQKDGLNLTRTFSGTYCENDKAFNIKGNTLAPLSGRFI